MRRLGRRIITGGRLLANASALIISQPVFLVPLISSWALYALLGLYLTYLHPWDALGPIVRLLTGFGAAFAVTLTLTAANHLVLELIQQIERDQPASLPRALWETMRWNLLQSLLILLIWTPLWFIFTAIDLALGEEEDGGQADESMIGPAASVLAGNLRNFPLSRGFLRVLSKTMRMGVFLILPAIAWEERGSIQAAKRGLGILRRHLAEFSVGLLTSEIIAFALLFPLILFFSLVQELELALPQDGLPLGIIYFTLVWSFIFYIEQVFAALLFLWHLRWEAAREPGKDGDPNAPRLAEVPMPSLLDGIPELD